MIMRNMINRNTIDKNKEKLKKKLMGIQDEEEEESLKKRKLQQGVKLKNELSPAKLNWRLARRTDAKVYTNITWTFVC